MFNMFKQAFMAVTVFFAALEKLASATNHLSAWADETAGAFADEARIQRAAKLNGLNKDLAASALPAPVDKPKALKAA